MFNSNFNNVKGTTTQGGGGSGAPSLCLPDSGFSSAVPSIIYDEPNLPKSPVSYQMMDTSTPPESSSEMASKAIPTLIDLLSDEDPVVQSKASNMVLQLSQEKESRDIISNSGGMIIALLETLSETNNIEIIENGVGVLYNLAEYPQGRQCIYKFGGISELVRMLNINCESIVNLAITALHLLLLHQNGAKEAVKSSQGVPVMIKLLGNQNEQLLAIVIDCIRLIAFGDSETKLVVNHLGGTLELVRILQNYSYSNLIWITCSALKVLSACPENKKTIIECGGLQGLALQLDTNNANIDATHISNCLFTIRNLSNAAVNQGDMDVLLTNLMDILRVSLTDNPTNNHFTCENITCVAGILSNLTCYNQNNKQIVRRLGGVQVLIQTIMELSLIEEIVEPATCALRHLTCRYPEAEMAAHEIRKCQGLVPIINLLNSNNWALKKAVVGLIRNLALCDANIIPLREHYAIQKLADVLMEARINSIAAVAPMGAPFTINNQIEAIIEEVEATLTIMAKDPYNKEMIRDVLAVTTPTTDLGCDMTFNGF